MKEKIMIVEDEIIVAMDLCLRLQRLGYEVIGTFSTAEEAVKECGKTQPDVVLMDFTLKGELDGLQATELIHSLYNTPVIMLSAQPEKTGPVEPDGYLVKPYELFGLKRAIQNALKN
ncbi:response regulator [bacterium]|nr:response regulator [bacterium]